MTTPETGGEVPPDLTETFIRAYAVHETAFIDNINPIIDGIQENDQLSSILRGHLQEDDMTLEQAVSLTIFESGELGIDPTWLEEATAQQQAQHDQGIASTQQAVGLQPSRDSYNSVEIADVTMFTNALQTVQMPADPDMAATLHERLAETLDELLYTTALAAKDMPPATLQRAPQRLLPEGVIDVVNDGAMEEILERRNPGVENLEQVIAESGRLAGAMESLGLPAPHVRGFRHLEIAAAEGVVHEFGDLYDAKVYSILPVGDPQSVEGRFGTKRECEHAVKVIQHLQQTIPGTKLVSEASRALLEDLQAAIDAPFNPEAGPLLTQFDVESHDQAPGMGHSQEPAVDTREATETAEATENTEATGEAPTPQPPDDEASLASIPDDLSSLFPEVEDATTEDLLDDGASLAESDYADASPEDSRRVKQAVHHEIMALLTKTRDDILAALPEPERQQFAGSHPPREANRETSRERSHPESPAATAGDVAAIIIAQETALSGVIEGLAQANETLTNAQQALEQTLGATNSELATGTLAALTAALESLRKGHTGIIDGVAHLKRYKP